MDDDRGAPTHDFVLIRGDASVEEMHGNGSLDLDGEGNSDVNDDDDDDDSDRGAETKHAVVVWEEVTARNAATARADSLFGGDISQQQN